MARMAAMYSAKWPGNLVAAHGRDVDDDQPLHQFGVGERDLHRDLAAHRVPDEAHRARFQLTDRGSDLVGHGRVGQLGGTPAHPDCRDVPQEAGPVIQSPSPDTPYLSRPDAPPEFQRLALSAAGAAGAKIHYWYVDGRHVGQTPPETPHFIPYAKETMKPSSPTTWAAAPGPPSACNSRTRPILEAGAAPDRQGQPGGSMPIKLHLVFQDRVGIVADLSRRIADRMFNIVAMEVDRVADLAHVYVDAENRQAEGASDLALALADIPGS